MKVRINNLSFEGVIVPIAEIELVNCLAPVNGKAKTHHNVSSVRTIEGEEVVTILKGYNHEFDYKGGNIHNEGLQSLNEYLADPQT
jgi:hypothetical protein